MPFSDQTFDAATDSVTATVNATTSPTEAQLMGPSRRVEQSGALARLLGGGRRRRVFAFGGAGFYGSQAASRSTSPIVGIASTPDGQGYWEVASDGGIFSFGDARFYGSWAASP